MILFRVLALLVSWGVWNPYVPNCTIGKEVYVIDTLQEPQ